MKKINALLLFIMALFAVSARAVTWNGSGITNNGVYYLSNSTGWEFRNTNGFFIRSNLNSTCVMTSTNGSFVLLSNNVVMVSNNATAGSLYVSGTLTAGGLSVSGAFTTTGFAGTFLNLTNSGGQDGANLVVGTRGSEGAPLVLHTWYQGNPDIAVLQLDDVILNAVSANQLLYLNANKATRGVPNSLGVETNDNAGDFGFTQLPTLSGATFGTWMLRTNPTDLSVYWTNWFTTKVGPTLLTNGNFVLPTYLASGGNTNIAMTLSNVNQIISDNFIDVGGAASSTSTNLLGIGSGTNAIQVQVGSGLRNRNIGPGTNVLELSGASGLVNSNYMVLDSNTVVWDFALVKRMDFQICTNFFLKTTNCSALSNYTAEIHKWENTNGTWRISGVTNVGGLARTNGTLWSGTNASQYDYATVRLDITGTNIIFAWATNVQPGVSFTNTVTAGGGGGGGGSWSVVAHTLTQGTTGDTTTGPLDTTGAKVIYIAISYTGGSSPGLADSKGNTWTTVTNSEFGGGNPRLKCFRCISPIVGSGHTFTASTVSGQNIAVLAFDAPSTPTADDISDSGQSGTGGQYSGAWNGNAAKPGTLTPAASTSVMITATTWDLGATTPTIDSSFTIPDTSGFSSTTGNGLQVAYKIKTADSSSENPSWNGGNGADALANIFGMH